MTISHKTHIQIDGSQGEGGGQILRTALSLSAITGQPLELINIRAGRARPGLLRQHLTAVQAAAEISGARVEGAVAGSRRLVFEPNALRGGDFRFAIGTAGSCTLVLQTALPILWAAGQTASISVTGGTHNPAAPPADFLIRGWLPLMHRMGIVCQIELVRPGFYPAGGGEVRAETGSGLPSALHLVVRGALKSLRATAMVAGVPVEVAQRELAQLARKFPQVEGQIKELPQQFGPGNTLSVEAEFEQVTETFTGFGQRGISAENVANRVAASLRAYLDSECAVAGHLADQLLLPLALAGGGEFTTGERSNHLLTNISVIEKFLAVEINCEQVGKGWRVEVVS